MSTITTESLLGTATWLSPSGARTAPLNSALLGEQLYYGDPVRHGRQYPRQRNVHGHYWCASTDRHVWHESLLERTSFMLLDHAADIIAIASQPMTLKVGDWWHVPDILVLHRDGTQTVFDVKPSSLLSERARDQFDRTATICRQVGWNYRVLTERRDQTRVNLEFLGQFRQPEHTPDEDTRAALSAFRPGWTVSDLVSHLPAPTTPVARAKAMRVLWDRGLVVDLSSRLTETSALHCADVSGLEAVDGIL